MNPNDARLEIPADWTFKNQSVALGFERHVREQLPWYEMVTGAVAHLARHHIPRKGLVYDVGASTGNIGRALADTLRARDATLVALEESEQMAELYGGPAGTLVRADAMDYEFKEFDVAICFLVMMFFQPHLRKAWLANLSSKCRTGGCVIIVDKVESAPGYVGTAISRLTLAGKVATGTDPAEIVAKELSLPGIQRPLGARFMETNFAGAHEFFRFGEFAGWIIESPYR